MTLLEVKGIGRPQKGILRPLTVPDVLRPFQSSSNSSFDNESCVVEKSKGFEESKLNATDLVVGEQKNKASHPSVDLGKPADCNFPSVCLILLLLVMCY